MPVAVAGQFIIILKTGSRGKGNAGKPSRAQKKPRRDCRQLCECFLYVRSHSFCSSRAAWLTAFSRCLPRKGLSFQRASHNINRQCKKLDPVAEDLHRASDAEYPILPSSLPQQAVMYLTITHPFFLSVNSTCFPLFC